MTDFVYQELFSLSDDPTEYRLLTKDHVSGAFFENQEILKVEAGGLTRLAEAAFKDAAHLLRPSHLRKLAGILEDPEASKNDRSVALELLKNAVIAAEGHST